MSAIDDLLAPFAPYPIRPASRRTPSESDLEAFEQELGGALPADYRLFLPAYGRMGLEEETRFPLPPGCPWGAFGTVGQFFGFSSTPDEDIVHRIFTTYAGRLPVSMIPIASDPGGNLLLLGVKGADERKVWFWDHEFRVAAARMDEIEKDLKAHRVDVGRLDEEALIRRWEDLFPQKLTWTARRSNLYPVASDFMNFLRGLYPG
jgi:hypothetical protein